MSQQPTDVTQISGDQQGRRKCGVRGQQTPGGLRNWNDSLCSGQA